jgi:hypothetical protein
MILDGLYVAITGVCFGAELLFTCPPILDVVILDDPAPVLAIYFYCILDGLIPPGLLTIVAHFGI